MGYTDTGSTYSLAQSPLRSPTVFNFFYPELRFPGALASAGLTTPEFQLTSDTGVALQMNFLEGGILDNSNNTNGLSSFTGGNGAIVLDIGPWMTTNYTANAGMPALVDSLNSTLLAAASCPPPPRRTSSTTSPTRRISLQHDHRPTPQMRDRVRAVVHLIINFAGLHHPEIIYERKKSFRHHPPRFHPPRRLRRRRHRRHDRRHPRPAVHERRGRPIQHHRLQGAGLHFPRRAATTRTISSSRPFRPNTTTTPPSARRCWRIPQSCAPADHFARSATATLMACTRLPRTPDALRRRQARRSCSTPARWFIPSPARNISAALRTSRRSFFRTPTR